MPDTSVQIRKAEIEDLPILARFGLALAHLHVSFDEQRFVLPADGESAFQQFFRSELARPDAVVLIAEMDQAPFGYAFVRLEPANLEGLCNAAAWLHDIYVVPEARGQGAGRRLVEAAFAAARRLGSDRLMLGVSPHNAAGRALFEQMGFRPTMIEMTASARPGDA